MALSVKFYRNFGSRSEELWDYFLNGSNYFFHFAASWPAQHYSKPPLAVG
jgi:hypothetical protein